MCEGDVAPFAGAWIEIKVRVAWDRKDPVAPFAGAWIEMRDQLAVLPGSPVAPFAGAWIEIINGEQEKNIFMSLPSRERGLKSKHLSTNDRTTLSLPSRERGLKSK